MKTDVPPRGAFARIIDVDPYKVDGDAGADIDGDRGLVVVWRDGLPVAQSWFSPESKAREELTQAVEAARRVTRPAEPTNEGVSASIVICTRDRPDGLARCLASLPDQTFPPAQIIVVDNASRDGRTRRIAEAAGVTYLREDRPGLDNARNTGALAATEISSPIPMTTRNCILSGSQGSLPLSTGEMSWR